MGNVRGTKNLRQAIYLFHREEEGATSLEVITVIAIGVAIIYVFAKLFWPMILNWTRGSIKEAGSYRPI